MIVLALLTGVVLGLHFRIGLVATATAAVLALDVGVRVGEDRDAIAVVAEALLCAGAIQGVALLVHILKHGLTGSAGAQA